MEITNYVYKEEKLFFLAMKILFINGQFTDFHGLLILTIIGLLVTLYTNVITICTKQILGSQKWFL